MSQFRHKTGLLIVGHGTRSQVGAKQFLALTERIRERSRGQFAVEPAFLELQQPDMDVAVGRLVDVDVERLVTMPLLLFAAGHAKEDVPGAVVGALSRRRGDVVQIQARHLGCHSAMVELSGLRASEALAAALRGGASGYCGPREDPGTEKRTEHSAVGTAHPTCLLLVGRGSRDALATAEMYEFARLRADNFLMASGFAAGSLACASGLCEAARREPRPPERVVTGKVEVAFLAMARPLLAEQLAAVARQGYRRVIVQPHLLFQGELVDSMERQVAEARNQFPGTEWLTTQALADLPGAASQATELLEKVILDRCQEAGIHVVAVGADD